MIFNDRKEMVSVKITEKDIANAMKAIKNGKGGGTLGIIGKLLKYGGTGCRGY